MPRKSSRGGPLEDQLEALFKDEYHQILILARSRLSRERAPISTMTLAHELYLDLRDRSDLRFETKHHFLAYVSRAMRSLLVDMARERLAQKRFAELLPLTAGGQISDGGGTPEQLVALDNALERLGGLNERLLRIAEMRVIIGMELGDIATAMGLSAPTIKREWQRAKVFLHEAIGGVGD